MNFTMKKTPNSTPAKNAVSASALSYSSFEATVTRTTTVTTTSTATCAKGALERHERLRDRLWSSGITLGLATNPYVQVGNNQSFHVSIKNDLPTPNHANFTRFPPLPNVLNPSLTSLYTDPGLPECSSLGFPNRVHHGLQRVR